MRVIYDSDVDILNIYLSTSERHTSKEIGRGIIADMDKDGNIIALEIMDASERYSIDELAKFTFERAPA